MKQTNIKMNANKQLVQFIKKARQKGFDDIQIRTPLLKQGWPLDEIEKAFSSLTPKYKFKNQISVFLSNDILKIVERRAKRNMLSISEQIEDILRRSCLNSKKRIPREEKLDDKLVSL